MQLYEEIDPSVFARDLETLSSLDAWGGENSLCATPCLRAEFVVFGQLAKFKSRLDSLLYRVAILIQNEVTYYGGHGGFANGNGRTPKLTDIEQLKHLTEIMADDRGCIESNLTARKSLRKSLGVKHTKASGPIWEGDAGVMFLGDAYPPYESASHIFLKCGRTWTMSLAFSASVVASHGPEISKIIEEIFTSGIVASGSFGFAANSIDGSDEAFQELHYLPPTRRFKMLNITSPGVLHIFPWDQGVVPINSWYTLSKVAADWNGIEEADIRALKGQVYALEETEFSFFIKLYSTPILGDMNEGFNLAPALALGALLDPILKKQDAKGGILLGDDADNIMWLRRFSPELAL